MANAVVKLKLMPSSPEVDLEKLKEDAKEKVKELGGMFHSSEEEPVAFGLKAVFIVLLWPEEKDTSLLEDSVSGIEGVNSVQIVDYRREFG